jgi:hypothetical protein
MKHIFILLLSISLISCATMRDSILTGAAVGGATGALVGNAAGQNTGEAEKGTLTGAAIGIAVGGLVGYLSHKGKEKKEQSKVSSEPNGDADIPFLRAPSVRRYWQPDKIDGRKFIKGHFVYEIEENSTWTKP